jgi:hypothetical protein
MKEEDGSLSIKLEGEIKDVPLLEQLCVLKEVDLHYKWAPFCSSSMTIADLDKLDTVGWFMVGLSSFGIARDGCFRAIGCDNIEEDGSVLLAGHGLQDRKPTDVPMEDTYLSDDPVVDVLDIPPIPSRRGGGRMTIRKFDAKIQVTSPTSARTHIVANIDPNLAFLPQSLLEFIMKHLAGVLMAKLQVAARKIAKNPVTNVHAIKMREEKGFYKDWLMVKFQYLCDQNGWEMPQASAYNMSEQELKKAGRKTRRMDTYSGPEEETPSQSINGDESQPSGDGCSELTTASTRSWMSNPIGSYLREIEEKTRQRKEAGIAEARRRAADRLKPSDIPRDRQTRLDELKKAKERRLMTTNRTLTSGSDAVPARKLSLSQRIISSLYSQGRNVIIPLLVVVLFIMLHPEFLLRASSLSFASLKFDPDGAWWKLLIEDAGVVVYIWLCSIVHFVLCDIALIYAFEALEIGSKSGQQVKQFYSSNVRFGVASLSAAILGFSVLKAATKVWSRAAVWYLLQLFVLLRNTFWPYDFISVAYSMLPRPVLYTGDILLSLSYSVSRHATRAWAYVPLTRLVSSSFLGRTCLRMFESSLAFVVSLSRDAMDFISTAIDGFEGNVSITSWRTEAFATAGSLFSYTSIFLLTILVLFNLSAKNSRWEKKPTKNRKHVTIKDTTSPSLQTATSSLSDDNDDAPMRTRQNHATIPEHEVVFHDMGNGTLEPFSPESSHDGASTTSTKKRRLRFGFRRNKTYSPIQPIATSKISRNKTI